MPLDQLLLSLRFYATGCFQNVLGDFTGLHRTTAGSIIRRVSQAIARLRPNFVKMPQTEADIFDIKMLFFQIAQFPRVIGAIDCTHVRIQNLGNYYKSF